jgi:hypothetical protein
MNRNVFTEGGKAVFLRCKISAEIVAKVGKKSVGIS